MTKSTHALTLIDVPLS